MAGEMRRPNREEEQSELRRGNAGRRLPPELTSSGIGCKRLARMVVGGSKKKKIRREKQCEKESSEESLQAYGRYSDVTSCRSSHMTWHKVLTEY